MIDEEVRKLVKEAYDKTRALLEGHREALEQVSQLLLQKEIIYKEDLEAVLGNRTKPLEKARV